MSHPGDGAAPLTTGRQAWQPGGILLSALATLGFATMHVMIRQLGEHLHPFQIAFFRNFFGLLPLLPVFARRGWAPLRTGRIGMHLVRAVLQVSSMLLFFTALTISPLAQISAISFTAPLFATIGAVLFLRERIHVRRVVALLVGFAGTLVVLRPGTELGRGTILVLISSTIWAGALLVIKSLAHSDSSITLAAWMGVFMAPISLVPAIAVWIWPTPVELLWLAAMGSLGTVAHLLLAQAFRVADAAVVLPVDFTRLIWAAALGYLFFAEIPEVSTWIGGAMIFASTIYIAWRESRRRPQPPAPEAHQPPAPSPGLSRARERR